MLRISGIIRYKLFYILNKIISITKNICTLLLAIILIGGIFTFIIATLVLVEFVICN